MSVSPPEKPPSSYLPAYSSGASSISPAHLRFFAALGADRPNAVFFAGDLGERIFQQPFRGSHSEWTSVGVLEPCVSITAPPTKSARRRTACLSRS